MAAVEASPFAGEPPVLLATRDVLGRREDADGLAWLAFNDCPLRVSGGGQPADRGWLVATGDHLPVHGVRKEAGFIWVAIAADASVDLGDAVTLEVDVDVRLMFARAHTLTHVMMGCLKKSLPGFDSRGAEISAVDGTAELLFTAPAIDDDALAMAVSTARAAITQDLPVQVLKAKSVDDARRDFPLFRMDPDLTLGGKIRLINIPGVDTNPCSGSHVARLGLIGVDLEAARLVANDARFRMTVGLPLQKTQREGLF